MINIDWNIVDTYLEAGCDGTEIAALIGCSFDTLSRRIKDEKNADFADYKAAKRSLGKAQLRLAQFRKAIKEGDTKMQIWLGKQLLDQKEKVEQELNHSGVNLFFKPFEVK